jgi:hypothetical protein
MQIGALFFERLDVEATKYPRRRVGMRERTWSSPTQLKMCEGSLVLAPIVTQRSANFQ